MSRREFSLLLIKEMWGESQAESTPARPSASTATIVKPAEDCEKESNAGYTDAETSRL